MSRCRSCGAPILWATTLNSRSIPLDVDPVAEIPRGAFRLVGTQSPTAEGVDAGPVYVSHFATCPNADDHRKGKT